MTESQSTDDLLETIDRASDEYDTRREREQERHEKKMATIEENAEETWEQIAEDAGLDAVDELHDEIRGLVETFIDLRKEIRVMTYKAITDDLSGGYNQKITVKNGKVYKYNRSRNASIDFMDLVNGYYRDDLEAALKQGTTAQKRKTILHGLNTIDAKISNLMELSSYSASTEYDGDDYDILEVRYKTRKHHSDRKNAFYIGLNQEERFRTGRKFSPVDRTPAGLKFLVQNRDEIIALQDQIREDYFTAIEDLMEVKDRLATDLPGDFE